MISAQGLTVSSVFNRTSPGMGVVKVGSMIPLPIGIASVQQVVDLREIFKSLGLREGEHR